VETFDAITRRVSVRKYQDKPVDKTLLEKMVDAGRRAPTARKVEPWEFVAVQNKDMIKKLGETVSPNGAFLKDASAAIIIFCAETKYYLEDGCAALENILLIAADLGLGACWIAGDKKDYCRQVAELLGASEDLKLIGIISLGYPAEEKKQERKRSLAEVIHWEKINK